jgi:hypothetical protein
VLDEAGWVGSITTSRAKLVLEGRERADPAGELDPCPPSRRRDVHPSGPRPPRDEQATEHHEENESEMEDNRGVGEDAEAHNGKNVAQRDAGTAAPTSCRQARLVPLSRLELGYFLAVLLQAPHHDPDLLLDLDDLRLRDELVVEPTANDECVDRGDDLAGRPTTRNSRPCGRDASAVSSTVSRLVSGRPNRPSSCRRAGVSRRRSAATSWRSISYRGRPVFTAMLAAVAGRYFLRAPTIIATTVAGSLPRFTQACRVPLCTQTSPARSSTSPSSSRMTIAPEAT